MYSIGSTFITHKDIDKAIKWITNCDWSDDTSELTDLEIVRGIEKHYTGGWKQFLIDGS